jgi:serine/threonine protein kinase
MEILTECVIALDLSLPQNLHPNQSHILVDATSHARITDFGLAMATQDLDSIRGVSTDRGHSVRWFAPEILNNQGTYSKEADVFSFAGVAIEVRRRQVTQG